MPNRRHRPDDIARTPIEPDRIRSIDGQSFAWIPHRFLQAGFFAELTADERSLYLFLVLAGDRNGVSYYGPERISSALGVTLDDYVHIRNSLLALDLIAFDGKRFQVLGLPARPLSRPCNSLRTREDLEAHDPLTIRELLRDDLFNR
jgi:hypothetical protein